MQALPWLSFDKHYPREAIFKKKDKTEKHKSGYPEIQNYGG